MSKNDPSGKELGDALFNWLTEFQLKVGNQKFIPTVDPGPRIKLDWPPQSVCYGFNISVKDWNQTETIQMDGKEFILEIAENSYGVFGRCHEIWLDARGKTKKQMLEYFRKRAVPLLKRSQAVSEVLGIAAQYHWNFHEFDSLSLLKLLFCRDRDVANCARIEIDARNPKVDFTPSLTIILRNRSHPFRRIAQWCALDIFEDLSSFCKSEIDKAEAIDSIKNLLWDAQDDHARAVYKAGVVLGGHLPASIGGPILLECLNSPSLIGRRSAIHALFHVVEWAPTLQSTVVERLRQHSETEENPQLAQFAFDMAEDIDGPQTDAVPEPIFDNELDS